MDGDGEGCSGTLLNYYPTHWKRTPASRAQGVVGRRYHCTTYVMRRLNIYVYCGPACSLCLTSMCDTFLSCWSLFRHPLMQYRIVNNIVNSCYLYRPQCDQQRRMVVGILVCYVSSSMMIHRVVWSTYALPLVSSWRVQSQWHPCAVLHAVLTGYSQRQSYT